MVDTLWKACSGTNEPPALITIMLAIASWLTSCCWNCHLHLVDFDDKVSEEALPAGKCLEKGGSYEPP